MMDDVVSALDVSDSRCRGNSAGRAAVDGRRYNVGGLVADFSPYTVMMTGCCTVNAGGADDDFASGLMSCPRE